MPERNLALCSVRTENHRGAGNLLVGFDLQGVANKEHAVGEVRGTAFGMARDGVSGDLQVAPPMWDCLVHARQYAYSPEKE